MKFLTVCTVITLVSKTEAFNNEVGIDTDLIRESAFEARRLVDNAYRETRSNLKARIKRGTFVWNEMLAMLKRPISRGRLLTRASDYMDMTREIISSKLRIMHPDQVNATDMLTPEQKAILNQLTECSFQYLPQVCAVTKYRTITGECNNKDNPALGSSNTGILHLIPPEYEDGTYIPRGWTDGLKLNGFPLPNVRNVSNMVVNYGNESMPEDDERSVLFMQWGQILDHDITLSPDTPARSTFFEGVDCNSNCIKSYPCFPIPFPENDTRIRNSSECIPLFRSAAVCNCSSPVRQPINVLTAFIDGSLIYGSDREVAYSLINHTSPLGLLAVNQNYTDNGRDFLPFDDGVNGVICLLSNKSAKIPCFKAGDVRVSEQVGLTSVQTLLLRTHNGMVRILHKLNPHWCKAKQYQEARKIMGSIIQKITFKTWLPLMLGSKMSCVLPPYTKYNSSVDPRVSNVFTNGYRVGHTLVPRYINRLNARFEPVDVDPALPISHAFFAPYIILQQGGISPILRGMMAYPAKRNKQGQIMDNMLRDNLFKQLVKIALDLAAVNLQRARERGLPGYCKWREYYGLSCPNNETELAEVLNNTVLAKKFIDLYGTPLNIDLWVAAVSEPQVLGGRVGELLAHIIGHQFRNLRDGDSFYYENDSVHTAAQRKAIEEVTLSTLICEHTDITKVPKNIFLRNFYPQDFVSCSKIPKMNLDPWKDSSESEDDDVC